MSDYNVYISGPIKGVDETIIKEYQHKITDVLQEGFRHFYLAWENCEQQKHFSSLTVRLPLPVKPECNLVESDMACIRASDMMVVYPFKSSTGTPMEVMYAFMIGIPVVLINYEVITGLKKKYISPWMGHCVSYIANSERDLYAMFQSQLMAQFNEQTGNRHQFAETLTFKMEDDDATPNVPYS